VLNLEKKKKKKKNIYIKINKKKKISNFLQSGGKFGGKEEGWGVRG